MGKMFGELAFENGFYESPQELWRVYSTRDFKGRSVRQSNWFATEDDANKYAKKIIEGCGDVLSITKYRAVGSSC